MSCVTRAHVDVGRGYARTDAPQALVLAGGDPVALRGDRQLTLSVGEQYRIVESSDGVWEVRTTAYFYAIGEQQGGELLAYHWHPQGRGTVVRPHLHVKADARGAFGWLGKVHLPTGLIRLAEIVLLAIEDLEVAPIRDDWRAVMEQVAPSSRA